MDTQIVFGVDVSKHKSNIAIVINGKVVDEFKITHTRDGFKRLDDALNHFKNPQVIFESSGVYSRTLRAFLQRNNWSYTEINPLAAKKDMDSFRHNKNDQLDAVALAQAMNQHHYAPTFQEQQIYSELRDMERSYQEFNEDIVRAKNRLHQKLQITFPEIEKFMSTTDSALYWHVVQQFSHPDLVLELTIADLSASLLNATPKNMSVLRATALAERLRNLALNSAPAVRKDAYAVTAVKQLAQEVERISEHKAEIIQQMETLAKSLPELEILQSIPGFGVKTTVCVIAELGDIRRFHSANAINAYIGIDLIQYQSGDFEMAQHIRKRGNAYARKILFKTILNMISTSKYHPSNVSVAYEQKKQSSSAIRTKKIAIAAMSRLIRTIYHLIKYNELYDSKMFLAEL